MAKAQKELGFDPAVIGKTSDAIRQIELAIAEHEDQRRAALMAPDGLSEIRRLDGQIAGKRADIGVLREREAAVEVEAAKVELARREQRRLAAVADVKTRVAARVAAAAKLDQALTQLSEAFTSLERADAALFADWPAELLPVESVRFLRMMNAEALTSHRRQRTVAGVVRDTVNRGPYGFADEVIRRNDELVAALEAIPLKEADKAVAS
jgi:chromosome segregation ATPase